MLKMILKYDIKTHVFQFFQIYIFCESKYPSWNSSIKTLNTQKSVTHFRAQKQKSNLSKVYKVNQRMAQLEILRYLPLSWLIGNC